MAEHHLGGGHEHVSGSDDLLYGLDALGSEGHGGDRLGTSALVDLVDTGDVGRDECDRIDGCGCAHDDLIDTGDPCGYDRHEDGAGIGCASSGDVATDPLQRCSLHTEGDPGFHFGEPETGRLLHLMETLDVVSGVLELLNDLGRDLLVCLLYLIPRDDDGFEIHLVELLGKVNKGLVALFDHHVNDALDGVVDLIHLGFTVLRPEIFADLFPHDIHLRKGHSYSIW